MCTEKIESHKYDRTCHTVVVRLPEQNGMADVARLWLHAPGPCTSYPHAPLHCCRQSHGRAASYLLPLSLLESDTVAQDGRMSERRRGWGTGFWFAGMKLACRACSKRKRQRAAHLTQLEHAIFVHLVMCSQAPLFAMPCISTMRKHICEQRRRCGRPQSHASRSGQGCGQVYQRQQARQEAVIPRS